ncbi:DNA integration/recombination/inversion protein (plasmid) [Bacillus smithii]|nr:DNA integration/recombination/inversion protein [Bacillus smithii]
MKLKEVFLFVLGCETGLRVGDLLKIKTEAILRLKNKKKKNQIKIPGFFWFFFFLFFSLRIASVLILSRSPTRRPVSHPNTNKKTSFNFILRRLSHEISTSRRCPRFDAYVVSSN